MCFASINCHLGNIQGDNPFVSKSDPIATYDIPRMYTYLLIYMYIYIFMYIYKNIFDYIYVFIFIIYKICIYTSWGTLSLNSSNTPHQPLFI